MIRTNFLKFVVAKFDLGAQSQFLFSIFIFSYISPDIKIMSYLLHNICSNFYPVHVD